MIVGAIPTTDRRPTTRPGNLFRSVTQPGSLRCALPRSGTAAGRPYGSNLDYRSHEVTETGCLPVTQEQPEPMAEIACAHTHSGQVGGSVAFTLWRESARARHPQKLEESPHNQIQCPYGKGTPLFTVHWPEAHLQLATHVLVSGPITKYEEHAVPFQYCKPGQSQLVISSDGGRQPPDGSPSSPAGPKMTGHPCSACPMPSAAVPESGSVSLVMQPKLRQREMNTHTVSIVLIISLPGVPCELKSD